MKRLLLVLLSIGCLYYLYGQVSSIPASSGGGGGAPTDASYITLGTNGTLTSERVFTAGSGLTCTDAGAGSTYTCVVDTAVIQSKSNLQSGATLRCASSTGSDDYKCTMTPTLTAYTDGMVVEFEATATANSGAATLEIDNLGGGTGVAIKKCDGSTNPDNSDITVGRQIALRYDGTVFRLPCNPQSAFSALTGGTNTGAAMVVGSGASFRANSADATAPNKSGTSLPGTCTAGDTYIKTDAALTAQHYVCSSGNTWTAQAPTAITTLAPYQPLGIISNGDGAAVGVANRVVYVPFVAISPSLSYAYMYGYATTNDGSYAVGVYDGSTCSLLFQSDTKTGSGSTELLRYTFTSPTALTIGKLYFLGVTSNNTNANWWAPHYTTSVARWDQFVNDGLSAPNYIAFYDSSTSSHSAGTTTMPSACSGTRTAAPNGNTMPWIALK